MAAMASLEAIDLAQAASAIVCGWLAVFFGRTLAPGRTPLIERIARAGTPDLPPVLCRYTRRLTVLWCGYFVAVAVLQLLWDSPTGWGSVLVGTGSAVLFVGEHRMRRIFFPGQRFPGLRQQVRDTWHALHPRP